MLGFQRREVRMWEWEMLLPHDGPLPQISHTDATSYSLIGVFMRRKRALLTVEE